MVFIAPSPLHFLPPLLARSAVLHLTWRGRWRNIITECFALAFKKESPSLDAVARTTLVPPRLLRVAQSPRSVSTTGLPIRFDTSFTMWCT